MNLFFHKHAALALAKIAPYAGAVAFIASFEAGGATGNPWLEIWRVGFSGALGIFIALVGAIYQNMNRRLISLEKAAEDKFIPRLEYEQRHEDLKEQLNRIERLAGR